MFSTISNAIETQVKTTLSQAASTAEGAVGTVNRNYMLGEFMNIWRLNLDGKTVKTTVNGKPQTYFRDYVLRDGEQIELHAIR